MPDAATFELIEELNNRFLNKASAREVIQYIIEHFKSRTAFASSMGAEDQVITEMIAGIDRSTRIFTLDTGRLFPETYDLLDSTVKRYKVNIEVYNPDTSAVEQMVKEGGINLFYESVEKRKLCCGIRKVEIGSVFNNFWHL